MWLIILAPVHLGTDQIQIQHAEQPPTLMMMGQCQRRHIDDTIITDTVGLATIYKKDPTPTRSTVDQMWSRISTKISSNSNCQLLPHTAFGLPHLWWTWKLFYNFWQKRYGERKLALLVHKWFIVIRDIAAARILVARLWGHPIGYTLPNFQ